ncbi:MAG: hypothetical protein VW397_08135 [Candidatus Margulisiibacteriota bacterium]
MSEIILEELASISHRLEKNLETIFSIESTVNFHHEDGMVGNFYSLVNKAYIVYEFTLNEKKGVLIFSNQFSDCLESAFLGKPCPKASAFRRFIYSLIINKVFDLSEMFNSFQWIERGVSDLMVGYLKALERYTFNISTSDSKLIHIYIFIPIGNA